MKKEDLICFANNFIAEVLQYESYFRAVKENKGWDLIILGGSNVRGFNDYISDLDLFLVVPATSQLEFNLLPVNDYKYKGIGVDVSMIATEKVIRDMDNKMNYSWWMSSIILYYRNKTLKNNFLKASSLSQPEFLEIIWTNFVIYEINTSKIYQSLQRNDLVSSHACFNENIESLIMTILADEGVFCHNKWYGHNLKKINPDLYKKILTFYKVDSLDIEIKNQQMKEYFIQILKKAGFSETEISNYEKCNLSKLLFQRL